MRMRLSRPLQPRKQTLPLPRLPWSEQAELWQKKCPMPRLDASAMTQPLGGSTHGDTIRYVAFYSPCLFVKTTTVRQPRPRPALLPVIDRQPAKSAAGELLPPP